jgi:hypothetical protein
MSGFHIFRTQDPVGTIFTHLSDVYVLRDGFGYF